MKTGQKILLAAAALLAMVPAYAVLNEKDLPQTLSVLRHELRASYKEMEEQNTRTRGRRERQHLRLVQMMQRSNELSLMLYSQKQDYTFDMTYALNEVSRQYEEFAAQKLPYDDMITRLDIDIDRYDRLIHTLRSLPPSTRMEYLDSAGNVVTMQSQSARRDSIVRARGLAPRQDTLARDNAFELDSLGREDRDSCLFYAQNLLEASTRQKQRLIRDSTHYAETAAMLKSAYDYAQQRYKTVQNKIFIEGQTDWWTILKSFPTYWKQARDDAREKYSPSAIDGAQSQWRGPMVVGFSLFVLFYLIIAIAVSIPLVWLMTEKWHLFKNERITTHRFETTLTVGVILFAISIMIASAASTQNFFAMASRLLEEFAWMLVAILISLIIRLKGDAVRKGILLYLPILLLSLIIISLRIIFIPNSLLNIIFPPLLILFTVYQGFTLFRYRKALPNWDILYGWISLLMLCITSVVALVGFVLLGVQLLIWWMALLTLLQTITAVYDLLRIYYSRHIRATKDRYRQENPGLPCRSDEDLIAVTWPYSLIRQALLPVAIILSLPLSLYMASGVFDLKSVCKEYLEYPFLNVENYINLSFNKIIIVVSFFFIFRYLAYVSKAAYRLIRIKGLLKTSAAGHIHENQANFTLAQNLIGFLLWGCYVVMVFIILKIPTSTIKLICAGLATGMGFAMKDILNNFFYGVQLMSGRLRVGDYIECDGIRGKVDSISYQSTQIVATDGSVMAFPNATLFNKNFKNLTKNHSYELVSFDVGVKYGVQVDVVRKIIQDALEPLRTKDIYGRDIVDPAFGIQVRFKDFGDNSVNLSVLQNVTVEEHFSYQARAKERIYAALNENGIEIPFPQRDLYIKSVPEEIQKESLPH